ncbi:MAG: hypothetical protein ACOYU0_02190 [Nitrospirota bacterium]
MGKEKLPESKEITVKLDLNEAKECLKYFPSNLERVRREIEEAIEDINFWNFLRNCEYLEFTQADFHLTGLMTPGWHLYCKHFENKSKIENYFQDLAEEIREKMKETYFQDLPEEVKNKITGTCNRENCPIYTFVGTKIKGFKV